MSSAGCSQEYLAEATWEFTGGEWVNVSAAVGSPAPSVAAPGASSLVNDPAAGVDVLWTSFGGTDGEYHYASYASTWEIGNSGWVNVTAESTQPQQVVSMAFDSNLTPAAVIAVTANGSTWSFDGARWAELSAVLPDSLGGNPSMAMDPSAGQIILAGAGSDDNDTWTYSNGQWTNVTGPPSPSGGPSSGPNGSTRGWYLQLPLVWDPEYGAVVTYGVPASGNYRNGSTWAWLNGTWTNITGPTGPSAPTSTAFSVSLEGAVLGPDKALLVVDYGPTLIQRGTEWALASEPIPFLTGTPAYPEVGAPFNLTTTTYGGSPPYQVRYGGLPTGCPGSGGPTVACEPSESGAFEVEVNVTDSRGGSGAASLELFVAARLNVTFRALTGPVDAGTPWNLSVIAEYGEGPYRYAYSGFPSTCRNETFTVTCVDLSAGSYPLSAAVTDAAGVSASWNETLVVNPPLTISLEATPQSGEVGTLEILSATELGGTPPESVEWAHLPPGCTAPAGALRIRCYPSSAGTFPVSVRAVDAVGGTSVASTDLLEMPRLTLVAFSTIPSSPVGGGQRVLFVTATSGGVPPYQYSYAGIPSGCTPSNAANLSCVPQPGTWKVEVQVVDSAGVTVTGNVSLSVQSSAISLGWVYLVALGAGALVALVVALWVRRRRTEPPDAP